MDHCKVTIYGINRLLLTFRKCNCIMLPTPFFILQMLCSVCFQPYSFILISSDSNTPTWPLQIFAVHWKKAGIDTLILLYETVGLLVLLMVFRTGIHLLQNAKVTHVAYQVHVASSRPWVRLDCGRRNSHLLLHSHSALHAGKDPADSGDSKVWF